jgi:RNA polymerase sigma-70 factor, ECF subfamily
MDAATMDLVHLARKGDADARARLFDRYLPVLRRWATGRLPPWARQRADTTDLVQNALVDALEHHAAFDPTREGALQSYVRQAVLHRIREELNRSARQPAAAGSPLADAAGADTVERYDSALQQLSAEDREAIIARIEFGFSFDQVAVILGRPNANAARLAVRRALINLARAMQHVR